MKVEHNGHEYFVTLDDFDGAPDATGPQSLVGTGKTEEAAKIDLLEQLEAYV
jgi:hypothetical protein